MRNLNVILRSVLGAAAVASASVVLGCEEVDPREARAPVAAPRDTPPIKEEPPPPTVAAPAPPPKATLAASDDRDGDVATDEDQPKQQIGRARDALRVGELDRAMRLARLAVRKAPPDSKLKASAWNTLGRAQLKAGQRKDAIASFESAVAIDPSSSFAQNNLGLTLIYEGRYEAAVAALEEATDLEPVTGYMWNNLGMAYEHLDRLEEARVAYRHAVELKQPLAPRNLARLQGVKTVRTARADTVATDVHLGGEPFSAVDLPGIDGGLHGASDGGHGPSGDAGLEE